MGDLIDAYKIRRGIHKVGGQSFSPPGWKYQILESMSLRGKEYSLKEKWDAKFVFTQ